MWHASLRARTLAITALAALAAFAAVAAVVLDGDAPGWDRSLFSTFYSGETAGPPGAAPNKSELLDAVMPLLYRAGHGPAILLLVALTIAAAVISRRWRTAAFVAAAFCIVLLAGALKSLFARPAPFESHGGVSFPSGHAIGSMAIALAIAALLAPTRLRWPALAGVSAFVTAVAIAVVADGGHWPSDVLGGWLLAISWLCLLVGTFRIPLARTPT